MDDVQLARSECPKPYRLFERSIGGRVVVDAGDDAVVR